MLTAEQKQARKRPRLIEFGTRDAWRASRSCAPWPIGASTAAKVCCGKECEVWVEAKLGRELDRAAMPWLTLGSCLEAGILDAGRQIHGWTLRDFPQTNTLAHADYEWVRATLDAERLDAGQEGPINAKNVGTQAKAYYDYRDGQMPYEHTLQGQWECLVTGADRFHILALVGGAEVVPFTIERDDDVIAGMFDKCAEFRERYLIGNEEPEPDGRPETARALSNRATYEPESEVFLSDVSEAATEADWKLVQLEPRLKSDEEEKERCRNVIRQAMGKAQRAVAPSGRIYSWTKAGHLKVKA